MNINRGDVFYVYRTNNYGVEHTAGRPAVIVSTDRHNHTSQVVEVVYLTTQPQKSYPENIPCSATNADATILCSQITTVDKDRLSRYITTLTPSEMKDVERGLFHSLGMEKYMPEDMISEDDTEAVYEDPEPIEEEDSEYEELLKEVESLRTTKTVLATERNVYKSLYEDLLKKVVK